MTQPPERRRRQIEREFGVPVPGEILDPERWTRTALKSIPAGHLNWPAIFTRDAPIVLELGCGNGRFVLASAILRPGYDNLGVDILPLVIRYATRRANQRGLSNVRFAVLGARELLERHVAPSSITEIHCYHPQPYYEIEEYSQRLITPEFLWLVLRSLKDEGLFVIQTDNPAYWKYIAEVTPHFFDFQQQENRWPDAPKGRTRREIIALRRGLPVFRGIGVKRGEMDQQRARQVIESLPLPDFDADRSLKVFDEE